MRAMRLALAAATLALLAGAAPSAASTLPACAYGTAVPELRGFLPKALDDAADRYAAAQPDASTRAHARSVFAAAAAAYVYGLPQVTVRATVKRFPRNELLSIAKLATPAERTVVAPNNDTAYTVGNLDLSRGPLVIDVPDTAGRYYTFELLDAFTNAFAYIGHRTTGTKAGAYALVPPGWSGTLPAGVKRIDTPSNTIFVIGRTLVRGDADMPAVKSLQQRYTATPADAWAAGERQPPVVLDDFPPTPMTTTIPAGGEFIAALDRALQIDPPPAADRCALEAMAPAGVEPPSTAPGASAAAAAEDAPPPVPALAADAAVAPRVAAGRQLVDEATDRLIAASRDANDGWLVILGWIGRYEQRYLGRSVVTKVGLGANVPEESVYPIADTDAEARPLDGAGRYVIRFPKSIPAKAFWSLTMYDADYFMVENDIHRYAIGDRTPGLRRAPDGSLTLYLQHDRPGDPAQQANWLPAPAGPFRLMLRLYEPDPTVSDGTWKPPAVERLGAPPRISALRARLAGRRLRISWRATRRGTTTLTWRGRRVAHADQPGPNAITVRRPRRGAYVIRAVPRSPDGVPGAAVLAHLRVRTG